MKAMSGRIRRPVDAFNLPPLVVTLTAIAFLLSGCARNSLAPLTLPPLTRAKPALAEYHRAALAAPGSPDPHVKLALNYLTLDNLGAAEAEAQAAILIAPARAISHATLARVLLEKYHEQSTDTAPLQLALEAINKAIDLEPDVSEYLFLSFDILLELDDILEIERRLQEISRKESFLGRLAFVRGRVAARNHDYLEARNHFKQALDLERNPALEPYVAWSVFMAGLEAEAWSLYEGIDDGYLESRDRWSQIVMALKRGDFDAVEAQLRAIFYRPNDTRDLNNALDLLGRVRGRQLKAEALASLYAAEVARETRDWDRMEQLLSRALSVDQRVPDAAERLAELLLTTRSDPRRAIKVLQDASEQTVTFTRFHLLVRAHQNLYDTAGAQQSLLEFLQFVHHEIEDGHLPASKQALETMLVIFPVPSLWRFYVDLAVLRRDPSAIRSYWYLLERLMAPIGAEFVAITARAFGEVGDFDLAEQLLREGLNDEPTYAPYLIELAQLAEMQGDVARAEEIFLRLTVIQPYTPDSWTRLGQYYLRRGRGKQARDAFEDALSRDNNPSEALLGLSQAFRMLDQDRASLQIAEQLTAAHPSLVESWLELARAASHVGQYRRQEEALRRAVARDPYRADCWDALARFLAKVPQVEYRSREEALNAARRAVGLSESKVAAYLATLAEIFNASSSYEEALYTIELAIMLEPETDAWHRIKHTIRDNAEATARKYDER